MPTSNSASEPFDGIICIGGEDWWYHNRGHFDFQIMRRLAKRWPVLFVNSIGVRMPSPSEGRNFLSRIGRKARSLSRGLVQVEPGFFVYSPFTVPGGHGRRLTGWSLAPQIRYAARAAGIRRPLLWIHCPAGADLADQLDSIAVIMQRTDRFESFPEADGAVIAEQISRLKQRADLVVYAAPHLMAEEVGEVRRSVLITHGVEVDTFAAAGRRETAEPIEFRDIPRPRIGFVGGLDAHTFDPALFHGVAESMPDCQFVLVGGSSLPKDWCTLPNVHFLGRKPYSEIANYMAAADALIMPWNQSEWIKACNPIKLKEYLAVGRPVVTTDFVALDGWRDVVRVANGVEQFRNALRDALSAPSSSSALAARLTNETWDQKADRVAEAAIAVGLEKQRTFSLAETSQVRSVG